ncbi:MAG TPA: autotransporter-associated beta strand repeat-containing protein, partial [Verrucomicrobiae bacterium]
MRIATPDRLSWLLAGVHTPSWYRLCGCGLIAAGFFLAGLPAVAANVALRTSDAAGTSSFTGATNWNPTGIPVGTNTYFTGSYTIRTTNTTTTGLVYPFSGGALSIDAGGRLLGKMGNNLANNTTAGTIAGNFVLNGGNFEQAGNNGDNASLIVTGSVTVNVASGIGALGGTANGSATFEILDFQAPISGSAPLQVGGPTINAGADSGVVRLSSANPYSGTISVGSVSNNIIASAVTRMVQLNHLDAVSNATLNLVTTQANPLSFAAGANLGSFNLGGLTGVANQVLTDTAGGPVGLRLGANQSSCTYAGGLTGNGSLRKTGQGTLTLTGISTFTGSTLVEAGSLQLGDGGSTGSLAGNSTLTNNAQFIIKRNNSTVQGTHFSGRPIAGTGTFIQAGTGTTILNAANTYSGPTLIYAGKLVLNTTQTGTGAITVSNGAALGISITGDNSLAPTVLTLGAGGAAVCEFDGVNSLSRAPVEVGVLSVGGHVTLNILAGIFAASNSYPLIHWTTSGPVDVSAFTLGSAPGVTASLAVNGATLYLQVASVATASKADAPSISSQPTNPNDFALMRPGSAATIVYDSADASVVGITAGL